MVTNVFKKGTLSTEIEYIGIQEKKKQQKTKKTPKNPPKTTQILKAFQDIIPIFRINSINFRVVFFYM